MGILNCIFVIVGVIIGAGFASGKEIYSFFFVYGKAGVLGIIISAMLIGYMVYKTLRIIKCYDIKNYDEFLQVIIGNDKIKNLVKIIINIFLLVTFFVMCAGFSAYFNQEFRVNQIISSIAVSILCFLLLNKNIKGVFLINSILIPIIIIILIVLGIKAFNINFGIPESSSCNIWFIKAILYASYNSITLTSILISIKENINTKGEVFKISALSSLIIIMLGLIIIVLLVSIDSNVNNLDLPTVYAAKSFGRVYGYLYGIILLGAIITTAISSAYGFLNNISKTKDSYKKYNFLICFIAGFISLFGFSNMVNYLYPIFGFLGLIQFILITTKNLY